MSALQKKLISVGLIAVLLVGGAVVVSKENREISDVMATETADISKLGDYQRAETDLIFWYEDAAYTDFFEQAALEYFDETGVKVTVWLCDDLDYMGKIYDETMEDGSYPDVYLISGESLEEAYLYGLVAVNEKGLAELNTASNAVKASTYKDKLLGYPLSYNTCVFIYQNNYFETVPDSIQAFIDYSDENEPGENVEYLLEWDVNDSFYDFPFISNSVTFEKADAEVMNVVYDEALYQKDLEYFEQILESFSVDADKVSEESILANFRSGRTLAAIVDTNSLYQLDGYEYSMMQIPALNEELPAYSCAITDMLIVNDFSENAEKAADFAYFATVTMAEKLHPLSGHYSVFASDDSEWVEQAAYEAYEASVLAPDSQDAKDFWVTLEEIILSYF